MKASPLQMYDEEKRLMWCLRKYGAQPRSDLAQALQVSNAAVTKLSRNLIAQGLIEEVAPNAVAGRGRPTVPLRISAAGGYAVGVTVHTGILEIALVDYAGGIISLTREAVDPPDPRHLARMVDDRIHQLAVEHRLLHTRLLGVGFSVPGPALSRDGSRWNIVHSLPGWRSVPLKQILDETLGLPVWLENDATSAALAEYYLGGLINRCSTAIVILLGYGIGAGIIDDGRLFKGESGNAGEIGMFFPGSSPRPSTLDLLSTLRAAGCDITSIADFEEKTAGYGDTLSRWLDRAAGQLVFAINSAISWFDPGAIRLTSPLPKAIVQQLADRINAGPIMGSEIGWGDHRTGSEVGKFDIEVSQLGGASSTLGAALLPIHATIARG